MSRVGKKPISIPGKTKVSLKDDVVTVQGPKGTLTQQIHPKISVKIDDQNIIVGLNEEDRKTVALQGMTRSLLNNMVDGVSKGFERVLEINGIGYRAEAKGKSIVFNLGFSHPIDFPLPEVPTSATRLFLGRDCSRPTSQVREVSVTRSGLPAWYSKSCRIEGKRCLRLTEARSRVPSRRSQAAPISPLPARSLEAPSGSNQLTLYPATSRTPGSGAASYSIAPV